MAGDDTMTYRTTDDAPHWLLDAFGGGELKAVEDLRDWAVFDFEDDVRVKVPRRLLITIPTIPEEPDPGVYMLGLVVIERREGQKGEGDGFRWAVMGEGDWYIWSRLWEVWGGPGVEVRRLIPEPGPCQECVQPGGAEAPDDGPPRPDVDHRRQYWALRRLVELHDGPRDEHYEAAKLQAWRQAREAIRAADQAYALWPVEPQGAVAEQQPGSGAT